MNEYWRIFELMNHLFLMGESSLNLPGMQEGRGFVPAFLKKDYFFASIAD
jgi:hypothetical protein